MDNAIYSTILVGVGALLGIGVIVFLAFFPGKPTEEAMNDAKVLLELQRAQKARRHKQKKVAKDLKEKRDAGNASKPETAPGTTLRRRKNSTKRGQIDEKNSEIVTPTREEKAKLDSDEEIEEPDILLKKAIEGDDTMSKKEEHAALDEFYRRLTAKDGLHEDQLRKREKIKKLFGLSDAKIRLAVEYAKQGKKIPLSRGQKIEQCFDCGIILFLLVLLLAVLYHDYGNSMFYVMTHYLRKWFPNEMDVIGKALDKFISSVKAYT